MKEKKKLIILTSVILGVLVVVLGFAYAIFTFNRSGGTSELVLGDIWMKYNESNGISLKGALPGDPYSNYFEFIITGKNTYEEKDIWYDIRLTKGDVPDGKTEENRIEDKYLKFKLVEVNNEVETEILTDKTYDDLTNQTIHVATIPKNTKSYSKTYRLYMVISENLTIGNTEGSVSNEEFGNLFGSIKVATTGDFNEKEIPKEPAASETILKAATDKEISNSTCKTLIVDEVTYIRGKKDCVDYNYVWYSGKLWRVTSIYPDGTMKMITDDTITTISYGENNVFYTDENTNSYIYQWLNQDFLDTLYNHENIVEEGRWNASPGNESESYKLPETTMVSAKVGLLNSYEYYLSNRGTSEENGYLFIGHSWWLLNPYSDSSSDVWNVDNYSGSAGNLSPSDNGSGVRPSIYLKSNIEFSGGLGTVIEPYTIKGDKKEAIANTTLLNTRSSGEYVKIENDETNRLFRIVDKELVRGNITTKLVLNDYVKESDIILTKKFSKYGDWELWNEVDNTDPTYWRGYLNTTWLEHLNINMLEKGIYYLGYNTYNNYKSTVCSTISSDVSIKKCIENGTIVSNISSDDYVGILRVGEMFASQPSDYAWAEGNETAKNMFLITPYDARNIEYILAFDNLSHMFSGTYTYATRPSINLKSTIVIKSGSGTEQDPFVVGLPS